MIATTVAVAIALMAAGGGVLAGGALVSLSRRVEVETKAQPECCDCRSQVRAGQPARVNCEWCTRIRCWDLYHGMDEELQEDPHVYKCLLDRDLPTIRLISAYGWNPYNT